MSAAAKNKPSRTAFICAFAAIYIIWGSTYLGIRIAVETMPPFLMSSARFIIAGGILMALVHLRGAPKPTTRQWIDNAFIGTCLLLGGNGVAIDAHSIQPYYASRVAAASGMTVTAEVHDGEVEFKAV